MNRRDIIKCLAQAPIVYGLRGPCQAIAQNSRHGSTIRVVVNDIEPQFIPSPVPFNVLSCKDLVKIRNLFIGYTTAEVLASPAIDELYVKVRERHRHRLEEFRVKFSELEATWDKSEFEKLKFERARIVLGVGLAAIGFLGGLVATTMPILSLFIVSTVAVVSLTDATIQLFQITDDSGLLETVIVFSDAKFQSLSVVATSMGDLRSAESLDRVNGRTFGLLSLLLTYPAIYFNYTGVARLERLRMAIDEARTQVDAASIDVAELLSSKKKFVEYIRRASKQGATAIEKVWVTASLNECALAGSISISAMVPSLEKSTSLRPKP